MCIDIQPGLLKHQANPILPKSSICLEPSWLELELNLTPGFLLQSFDKKTLISGIKQISSSLKLMTYLVTIEASSSWRKFVPDVFHLEMSLFVHFGESDTGNLDSCKGDDS